MRDYCHSEAVAESIQPPKTSTDTPTSPLLTFTGMQMVEHVGRFTFQ